ncbi:MAG TPA: tetratricopeptide repeat protein [Candidatus Bathyarchaeia archaeon]|nr:tetratricopeptide repeat protein [Candidatus Bathyarchaeia archaeon]
MNTSKVIKPGSKCIKSPQALRNIKYQQVQARSRYKQYSIGRETAMPLGSSLILCLIAIIVLGLLPSVYVLAKVQKDIAAGNVSNLFKIGLGLYNVGNHTGAILYYNKALAVTINPDAVDALTSRGVSLTALENYTGAIRYYDKALAIDPHDGRALNDKGIDLYNLGNHTGAILYYNKALAVDPRDVHALTNKGLYLDELGNHTGAIVYFDKALVLDPHHVNALIGKAAALDELGSHTGTIEYYHKAKAIKSSRF